MGLFISFLVYFVVAAVVILIVSRLNLGLSVKGFGSALIAAVVIALVGAVISWLLGALGISIGGGFLGAIVNLLIAAVILLISGRLLPGFTVNGFAGAIVGAIGIGVVGWVITWLLGLIGIVV